MATAFDVLEGLITGLDPNIRPVFEQVGRVIKALSDGLGDHTKLNVNDFSAMQHGLDGLPPRSAHLAWAGCQGRQLLKNIVGDQHNYYQHNSLPTTSLT